MNIAELQRKQTNEARQTGDLALAIRYAIEENGGVARKRDLMRLVPERIGMSHEVASFMRDTDFESSAKQNYLEEAIGWVRKEMTDGEYGRDMIVSMQDVDGVAYFSNDYIGHIDAESVRQMCCVNSKQSKAEMKDEATRLVSKAWAEESCNIHSRKIERARKEGLAKIRDSAVSIMLDMHVSARTSLMAVMATL
jgi:hypothetical protein